MLVIVISRGCSSPPGEMGPMVASTLKLGIAILNGGNSTVQQVMLRYFTVIYIDCWIIAILSIFKCYLYKAYSRLLVRVKYNASIPLKF